MDLNILFNEVEESIPQRIRYRELRDCSNPLEIDERTFREMFRLNKDAFQFVLRAIESNVEGLTSTSVPPIIKLCTTLYILSGGCYQHQAGSCHLFGMTQSTVCMVFHQVLDTLQNSLCHEWIRFSKKIACRNHYYTQFRLPGVVGCVDGTHIPLLRPTTDEHIYLNRKGYHSLNALIICDHEMCIMAINARYGGAAHDSFVWRHCTLKSQLEAEYAAGDKHSFLLGDSGYPLEPWLLTPYRNPTHDSSEAYYNNIHSKARSSVERCIGLLKGRFRILHLERKPRYAPQKILKIVNVCAALHNVCKFYNVDDSDMEMVLEHDTTTENGENDNVTSSNYASILRNSIRDMLFNH